jgi:UDP-glucose 4-epimerase
MKKSILITGIAGLLGSRMAHWLVENYPDYAIIGIDDLSGGYNENIPEKVIFYKLNLVTDDIEVCFKEHSIHYVYHFAAYAAEGLSPFIRSFNYDNNLKATSRIVNYCIKYNINRLVFTSTLAVYGHGCGGFFDEDQIPKPIDPYGVAKFACEMDIQIAGEQHGLDWCIIRPHNVYGINQNIWDKYRNVLGIWMYQSLNDIPMTIYGSGDQTRAFSFIDDSLAPLWEAAVNPKASKEIINLGGIEAVSIKEANNIFKEISGSNNSIHLEQRHEVLHSIPTFEKSIKLLGFEHKTSLHEGLSKMWNWAKIQPKRDRFIWSNYELEKGIYSFWKTS